MKDCSRHLKEAIALNQERLSLYGSLSGGDSLVFSKKLIRYEKLALLGSWFFDKEGDRYQRKGIDYMRLEFVEMSEVSEFSQTYPLEVDYESPIIELEFKDFTKAAKEYVKVKQIDSIVTLCNEKLKDLDNQIHVYCMVRHLIESIRRIAFLVPIHEKQCERLKIKSPWLTSKRLISLHLMMLQESKRFDHKISIIQNRNIPILFQDLPHISIEGLLT